MDAAEAPGAAEEWLGFGCGTVFVEPNAPAARVDFPLEVGTVEIDHARQGNQNFRALAFDGAQNFTGIGGIFENYRGAEERRNEKGHELSEDVAERHQRDEAERMKRALVFQVGLRAAFDGFEVGEKISVRENDTARLGCGAGGEEDLRDVLAGERFAGQGVIKRPGCFTGNSLGREYAMLRSYVGQILQYEDGNGWIEDRLVAGSKDQFDLGVAHRP